MTDELRSWGTAALGIIAGTLRGLGYVEGRNIIFEGRYAERNYDALTDFATELVRLKVNVIVAVGTAATRAARSATDTIPIVFSRISDPVGSGLVASFARPASGGA